MLLNITPDHLDRYAGIEAYAAAKARLFAAQGPEDFAVVNADDARVAAIAGAACAARWCRCRPARPLAAEAGGAAGWVEGDELLPAPAGRATPERYPAHAPGLVGRHNQENALAAALAARLLGATAEQVRATLLALPPAAPPDDPGGRARRRAPTTTTRRGPTWARWWRRWTGFPRPVVLIAGGRDKGGSYEPLADALAAGGAGGGADRRGGRRASRRRWPAVVPVRRAATAGRGGGARPPRWPARATRWCCRPPAPASTCSATTSTGATCSAAAVASRWQPGRRRRRTGAAGA